MTTLTQVARHRTLSHASNYAISVVVTNIILPASRQRVGGCAQQKTPATHLVRSPSLGLRRPEDVSLHRAPARADRTIRPIQFPANKHIISIIVVPFVHIHYKIR